PGCARRCRGARRAARAAFWRLRGLAIDSRYLGFLSKFQNGVRRLSMALAMAGTTADNEAGPELQTDVLIAGGGPCGLMLANELGRFGVHALLLEAKPGTAFNPQANATQARTMEHFRRHGFAQEVREQGLPADHP